jgi:hypothetical protein
MYFVFFSKCTGQQAVRIAIENEYRQPLLMNSEANEQNEDGEEEKDDDEEEVYDKIEAQKPVTSIVLAYKLLTPSVKVSNPL